MDEIRTPGTAAPLGKEASLGDTAVSVLRGPISLLGRWLIRVFMLASAVLLALVISGGIFQVIPGVTIAHTKGISMRPTFKTGNVVLLRLKHPSGVHRGEIVLFEEDEPVTHRVIDIGPNAGPNTVIVTKGDNNPVADKPIKLGDVQGEVIGKLPLLGEASRWLGAGGGFYVYHYVALLLNLIFILVVAGFQVQRFNRESKQPLST